jgi:gliding motility-associated-like protein
MITRIIAIVSNKGIAFLKVILYTLLFSSYIVTSFAQLPEVKVVSKTTGSMEQIITLKGSGFGVDPAKAIVMFGAAKASIVSISDQVLVVKIPVGTTYDNIAITNLTSNLTGYTQQQFLLSFHGDDAQPFSSTNLEGQFDFPNSAAVATGLYDLCLCDFDGDAKSDLATSNDNSAFVNIFRNTSSGPGNIAFNSKISLNLLSKSVHIKCGDLNGDGKTDLVITEKGSTEKVYFLQNNSSGPGSFSFTTQSVKLAGKTPKHVDIADLDLDGKPELIISSQATNTISILQNKSTKTAILFTATPITKIFPNVTNLDALAVEDLNGDRIPEIITSQYQNTSNIFIVNNNSLPGSIILNDIITVNTAATINAIRVGDLDNDGKKDIAYTQSAPSASVGILINQTTGAQISFGSPQTFSTDSSPWGLDFGDLDGDGKTDIAVASSQKKSITILNNNSSPGTLAFQSTTKATTYLNRHVVVGDVDSDGKPDIAFTSIDDAQLNIAASKISVFRNKTCMIPEVTPVGPLNICNTNTVALTATSGGGISYEWTNLSTSETTAGSNTYTPSITGNYNVKAIAESGSCSPISNTVSVTIAAGAAGDPKPMNNGPVCSGSGLTLSLGNDLGTGFSYQWTDVNGTNIGTGPTVQITNVNLSHAGVYSVKVYAGDPATGCLARTESTTVQVVDIPNFSVQRSTGEVICAGDLSTLSVFPAVTGFTYQWYEKTSGIISAQTSKNLTRGSSGEFYFQATSTNPNCTVATSSSAKLVVANAPSVAFDAPATACQGQEVKFKNQSVTDPLAEVFYTWDFGDSHTSTDKDPAHIYTTTASAPYSVTLTVSYKNATCIKATNKSILITPATPVVITSNTGSFEFCEGQELELSVSGSYNTYTWSTGSTASTITIQEPGEYSVEVMNNGCPLKSIQDVTTFPLPVVTATAHPEIIVEGETTQLEASGLLNYTWEPKTSLSQPDIANPVANPVTSTLYTVSGTDSNGCAGNATVQVSIKDATVIMKLKPSNFFSPNGDAINQYWTIDNILDYPECSVTIFDEKGVKVYTAKPYLNDWDGTFNGKILPDGVYYFVIRCDGQEKQPKTGSITVLK